MSLGSEEKKVDDVANQFEPEPWHLLLSERKCTVEIAPHAKANAFEIMLGQCKSRCCAWQ